MLASTKRRVAVVEHSGNVCIDFPLSKKPRTNGLKVSKKESMAMRQLIALGSWQRSDPKNVPALTIRLVTRFPGTETAKKFLRAHRITFTNGQH